MPNTSLWRQQVGAEARQYIRGLQKERLCDFAFERIYDDEGLQDNNDVRLCLGHGTTTEQFFIQFLILLCQIKILVSDRVGKYNV
ncbi:MAG: hypothetical protein ACREBU_22845, partial [Nitrososphaera sp.]